MRNSSSGTKILPLEVVVPPLPPSPDERVSPRRVFSVRCSKVQACEVTSNVTPMTSENHLATHIKSIAGTLRLFASAFLPTFSHSSGPPPSSSTSKLPSLPISVGAGTFSAWRRPPMNVMSFATKSSMSNAPISERIWRAFAAPRLDAVRRNAESRVASCGPRTGYKARL